MKKLRILPLYGKRALLLSGGGADDDNNDDDASRSVVICDLHIGFEEEKFRASGIRMESNVESIAEEIESLIDENQLEEVIINGDVKSGIDRILDSEWRDISRFFSRIIRKARVDVIPGNHDGGLVHLIPEGVHIHNAAGMLVSDTLILHGHTRPSIRFKDCRRIIMGHIHPVIQKKGSPLSGNPVWVFAKILKKSVFRELLDEDEGKSLLEVILMPAFNKDLAPVGYAYDSSKAERKSGAPLVTELKKAEEALVVTLGGEIIGDASMLQEIL